MRSKPSGPSTESLLEALTGELDAPLAGVLAMAELLERQSLPADAAACIRTLREDAERAVRSVAAARDLAADAHGRLVLASVPFAPRRLLDELTARFADNAGPALLTAFDGDPELAACGDPVRLAQVLDAFVEHGRRGGRGPIEVTLTVRGVGGGGVALSAAVRLHGAAPANPEALFEAGRGRSALTLARAVVARMGGRIDTRANAGAGLTLAFEIALLQASEVPIVEGGDAGERPALHVLIVDDNATNRLVAEAFCDMFGCTSDSAEDGVEAVEAAGVRAYDLILMDVKMPRMDGVEATKAIRAMTGPSRDTPIVALTANADPDDIRRYVAAGMVGVVEKPIKAERLAEVINAVFEAADSDAGVRAAA